MSLRMQTLSSGRWAASSLVARGAMQLLQTIVLARLLSPEDFGLMAVVASVLAILGLLADQGLSSALIHFPLPDARARSTLFWLNFGCALLLAGALVALAGPLAEYFGDEHARGLFVLAAGVLPLTSLSLPFRAIAEKELRFKRLAVVETGAAGIGFAVALAVALAGGGAYALVAGPLASSVALTTFSWCWLSTGLRPQAIYDFSTIRAYIRYGAYRMGDGLINAVQGQLDIFIGSALLAPAAIGLYGVPRDLALRVGTSLVNPVATRVALPVMANLKHDHAALRSTYRSILLFTASINVPVYAAMALWSEEIVQLLLGPQWRSAADVFRILALWAMVRSFGNPVGSLLYATGRVRRAMWWNLGSVLVMAPAIAYGAGVGGPRGMAAALLAVQCALFFPFFRVLVRPVTGLRFAAYLGALWPPFLATSGALLIGHLVQHGFGAAPLGFAIGLALAATAYVLLSAFINRQWLSTVIELLRPVVSMRMRGGTR